MTFNLKKILHMSGGKIEDRDIIWFEKYPTSITLINKHYYLQDVCIPIQKVHKNKRFY